MLIAILGGSFDPPHFGHLLCAKRLIENHGSDEVWLMPCWAHVWSKKLSPIKDRLAMLQFLVEDKIKVCNLEIEQKRALPTVATLILLQKKYPQHQFFWMVGEKSRLELPRWQDYETIKKQIIIVADIKGISSSLIRQKIRARLTIAGLVPEKVGQYIKTYGLYKDS